MQVFTFRFLAICLFCCPRLTSAWYQGDNPLHTIRRQVVRLREKPIDAKIRESSANDIATLLDNCNQYAVQIEKLSMTFDVPADYEASLEVIADLASHTASKPQIGQSEYDHLRSIKLDLRCKQRFAEAHPDDPFSDVNVVVTTKYDGQTVSGKQVWFVASGWDNEPKRFKQFNLVSSPTNKLLPPGYYLMWWTDPKKVYTGVKKPVEVTPDKTKEQQVDVTE